ncbi:MAG: O-antigen ligase family protein [Ferruginibacter sp.]
MSKKKFVNRTVQHSSSQKLNEKNIINSLTPGRGREDWFIFLLLVLPVIFSRQTLDPAISTRYILLSVFIAIFVIFFYWLKKTPVILPYPPLIKYTFMLAIGYVGWSLISMFLSLNMVAGYYEVARGLLNIVLLFLITEMITSKDTSILKLSKAFVLIALVQGIIGILQYYDLAFTDLPGANAKPFGLMTNRNLFGSAQMLVVPFVLYVFYKSSGAWKYASAFAGFILVISLIISQTRSAWLSTLVILLIALILVSIYSATNRKKWIIATGIGALGILLIGFLMLKTDGELNKELKERTASFVNSTSANSESGANINERLSIWRKTLLMLKDKPVFGIGPANWKLNIASYGTAGLAWAAGYFVPDRVHNVFLQTATETGIPGLILYASMWALIMVAGIKLVIRPASEDQRILIILMVAGLGGFATDSMFSFPTERIEHSLYIILMAGIILGTYLFTKSSLNKEGQLSKVLKSLFIIIALLNTTIGFAKYNFEKYLGHAKELEREGSYQELLEESEKGKSLWVNCDQVGLSLEVKNAVAYKELKDYKHALEQVNIAMSINPNSPMVYNNKGTIYTEMKDYKKAVECYEKALKLAPDFDLVQKNLAINYFNLGEYPACIKALEKVDLKKDIFLQQLLNDAMKLSDKKETQK